MPQLEHSYGSSATTSQPRFFWGSSCRASEPPRTPLPKTWADEGHGGTGVWPLAGLAPGSRAGSARRRTRPTSARFSTCSSPASLTSCHAPTLLPLLHQTAGSLPTSSPEPLEILLFVGYFVKPAPRSANTARRGKAPATKPRRLEGKPKRGYPTPPPIPPCLLSPSFGIVFQPTV